MRALHPVISAMWPSGLRCVLRGTVVLVAACLVACGGDSIRDTEAARLWNLAIFEPAQHTFDTAAVAAEQQLAAAGSEATLDDRFLAGATAMLRGDMAGGVPLVDGVLQEAPGRPGVLLMQGFWHSSRHSRLEARTQFDACIDALAADREAEVFATEIEFLAHLFRGQERYLAKNYVGAIADLQHAQQLLDERGSPAHYELVRFLADSHVHGQEYGPAEAALRKALESAPDFPPFHFQLGMVLAAQVRTEEAAGCYRRTIELQPRDPMPRIKLAEIARRDGDLPAMRAELDALQTIVAEGDLGGELSAALGSYWIDRGRASAAGGDDGAASEAYARAREHLLRAVAFNPLCTRAFTLLVQVAVMLGAPDEEVQSYKDALDALDHAKSGAPAAAEPQRTFC